MRDLLSDQKVVRNPLLNLLGAQVARTVAARGLYHARRAPGAAPANARVETLIRDGVVVWEDFLPPRDFQELTAEFLAVLQRSPSPLHQSRDSAWSRLVNVEQMGSRLLPQTFKFLAKPQLRTLIEQAERRPWDCAFKRCNLQIVTQGRDPAEDDQTKLHVDTFFHTHKAWLYLTDVGAEDGCLSVVKTSHRLNLWTLWGTYLHSLRPGDQPSRRISPRELARLGLKETAIVCPANTLVVANVHAFHRRLPGLPGRARLSIHLSARANPLLSGRPVSTTHAR